MRVHKTRERFVSISEALICLSRQIYYQTFFIASRSSPAFQALFKLSPEPSRKNTIYFKDANQYDFETEIKRVKWWLDAQMRNEVTLS